MAHAQSRPTIFTGSAAVACFGPFAEADFADVIPPATSGQIVLGDRFDLAAILATDEVGDIRWLVLGAVGPRFRTLEIAG